MSVLNLDLKSLVHDHEKLKNVNHGVLLDALVEVLGTQILFQWIGLKKANKNVWNIISWDTRGGGWNPPPPPILDKNSPTRIGLKDIFMYNIYLHFQQ